MLQSLAYNADTCTPHGLNHTSLLIPFHTTEFIISLDFKSLAFLFTGAYANSKFQQRARRLSDIACASSCHHPSTLTFLQLCLKSLELPNTSAWMCFLSNPSAFTDAQWVSLSSKGKSTSSEQFSCSNTALYLARCTPNSQAGHGLTKPRLHRCLS